MTEDSAPPPPPASAEETVKKVRRFAPEPVETSTRSSKKEKSKDASAEGNGSTGVEDKPAGKRRFAPVPFEETTYKSSKRPANTMPSSAPSSSSTEASSTSADASKPRRKFVPELIETTKRSKKKGDTRPATLPTDKTDLTPGVPNIYAPGTSRTRRNHDDTGSPRSGLRLNVPQRQGSMRPHLNTRRSTRSDSFHPELDSITSSRSNSESEIPSLSRSVQSEESKDWDRIQLARTRESCDDRFSGFLLSLAAKAAEKQLKEAQQLQADLLSAFPNESTQEHVEHYYGGDTSDEEESVEGTGMLIEDVAQAQPPAPRRKSTDLPGGWELKEMNAHQATLDKIRAAAKEKMEYMKAEQARKKAAEEAAKAPPKGPFWKEEEDEEADGDGRAKDGKKLGEAKAMRKGASPPMLGADLKFRMCPSPKATKFESDQRVDIQPNRSLTGGGLWGGYCVAEDPDEYMSPFVARGPDMIQTPTTEREDPFASAFSNTLSRPASPKETGGVRMVAGIDERLKAEIARSKKNDALLLEFDDTFISQVYNYLSLGYPAIARQFDRELSKISKTPEIELRIDDSRGDAKGYIGISGPNFGEAQSKTPTKRNFDHKNYCARWKALKIYVLEWARQHPNLSNGVATPAWGVRERRGSWAL